MRPRSEPVLFEREEEKSYIFQYNSANHTSNLPFTNLHLWVQGEADKRLNSATTFEDFRAHGTPFILGLKYLKLYLHQVLSLNMWREKEVFKH